MSDCPFCGMGCATTTEASVMFDCGTMVYHSGADYQSEACKRIAELEQQLAELEQRHDALLALSLKISETIMAIEPGKRIEPWEIGEITYKDLSVDSADSRLWEARASISEAELRLEGHKKWFDQLAAWWSARNN